MKIGKEININLGKISDENGNIIGKIENAKIKVAYSQSQKRLKISILKEAKVEIKKVNLELLKEIIYSKQNKIVKIERRA